MSIRALLFRFLGLYTSMLILGAVAATFLGFDGGLPLSTAVLLASVLTACLWFSYRNKRYFTPSEKRHAVIGMLVIGVAVQVLLGGPVFAGQPPVFRLGSLLMGIAFVAALHLLVIWFVVTFTGKRLAKQLNSGV